VNRFCLVVSFSSVALLLPDSGLQGQSLPDSYHVANLTGQNVDFQDEVKAVSYSRSTNGYYLSFGAPYPHQVLSVWIDDKTYDRLPGHGRLVGRIVQINGTLESSPTGPLIRLAGRDHFKLLPADESVLSKPRLDGKQDRNQFKAAVWQTFKREDFETLEILGGELRRNRELLNDGSWLSEAFFAGFRLGANDSPRTYQQTEQRLAHWEQAWPESNVLPMIKGGFQLDLAWKWRGDDYAETVSAEGWRGFKSELATARQIIENNPAEQVYPEYYSLLQTVALGQGWPREEYMRLFEQAIRVEPEYCKFYCSVAHYLLPRWYGKKDEWVKFAEQQRRKENAAAGDILYTRIAESNRGYYHDFFRDSGVSWDVMASGYQYLIRQYPGSRYLKSLYANLCWKAGDRARLAQTLPKIRADPDMTVWVNLENVALAEKFLASDGR
jgi:hypothetical protein